ncbi:hypothetical protein [Spiroplasma endosymbiont of Dromius quadrimaculatus]|uniref:hypothetical protein n=1 Tax=Spiroplasma endosymbiont of Dromius quadrimaculatus TaxID=3066283 RepID=UPI00313EF8D3
MLKFLFNNVLYHNSLVLVSINLISEYVNQQESQKLISEAISEINLPFIKILSFLCVTNILHF